MAHSKVWADLSINQIFRFDSFEAPSDKRRYLATLFDLQDEQKNPKSAILLDFYYYTLCFARDMNFTPEKTSALFSILKTTHQRVQSTPFLYLEADYQFFQSLVLQHSIYRPPYSEKIFDFQEAKAITDYVMKTYFRHYALYKYVYTKKVKMNINVLKVEEKQVVELMVEAAAVGQEVKGELNVLTSDELLVEKSDAPLSLTVPTEEQANPNIASTSPIAEATPATNTLATPITESNPTDNMNIPGSSLNLANLSTRASRMSLGNVGRLKSRSRIDLRGNQLSNFDLNLDTAILPTGFNTSTGSNDPVKESIAAHYIATLVRDALVPKVDALRHAMLDKLQAQEEQWNQKVQVWEESIKGGKVDPNKNAKAKNAKK